MPPPHTHTHMYAKWDSNGTQKHTHTHLNTLPTIVGRCIIVCVYGVCMCDVCMCVWGVCVMYVCVCVDGVCVRVHEVCACAWGVCGCVHGMCVCAWGVCVGKYVRHTTMPNSVGISVRPGPTVT